MTHLLGLPTRAKLTLATTVSALVFAFDCEANQQQAINVTGELRRAKCHTRIMAAASGDGILRVWAIAT